MKADIIEAKRRLPLPALMHRLGLGEHAKNSALCPFHDDHKNSFSTFQKENADWRWKCFAGCGEGDEISFLERLEKLSPRDAIKRYLEMAGVSGKIAVAPKTPSTSTSSPSATPNWQTCVEALTQDRLEQLAKWRGFSIELCNWLRQKAIIGLYDECIALPIYDESRKVVATHRRLSNGGWARAPIGHKTHAIVIGELSPGGSVHVFESPWDAFAFMDRSGERDGIIITLGAENGKLITGLVPVGATVYAWKQNDELKNGKRAGDKWLKDVAANANARVVWPKIPEHFKDTNDWTLAGATADDLLAAMTSAEVICEPEKSWTDALNESVVTAMELEQLALKPRKKLLADWLCEGDLGFIFAFRGVGKTWFALSIAKALANGGRLGEWQAHEPVRVLYVDGEMPPDLMRNRSKGLNGTAADELHFLNHEILFERAGKVINITNPDVQQAITQRCISSRIKVLILDNLSTLASGMKENEADSWELVNNWLLELRRRKITVIIVHHAGRSGEMRGTSKREDNVFWIIALDDRKKNADDKRGARFVSRFTKSSRNTQEEIPTFEWHFVTDDATGQVNTECKQAQTMDVFLELLRDGVTECGQIAAELKVSPSTVSRLAKKAIDSGKVAKKGREYVLIEGAETCGSA